LPKDGTSRRTSEIAVEDSTVHHTRLRRTFCATFALGSLAAPAAAQACPGAGHVVDRAHIGSAGAATLCLLNDQRRRFGLHALQSNAKLARVAAGHSLSMVRSRYFAHGAFSARILGSGYARGARSWAIGENIAWGSGSRSTPSAIVSSWMKSPPHRANILSPGFRQIGVGIAPGTPAGMAGGTYTTDFGRRS
jgi:uncharacterized protein YkwD